MENQTITMKDKVREIVIAARNAGLNRLNNDTTTLQTDDQDCYPRAIHLTIDRSLPELRILKELEKEFEWLKVDRRRRTIAIIPPEPPKFRLSEFGYKEAIATCLRDNGLDCYVDVNWR